MVVGTAVEAMKIVFAGGGTGGHLMPGLSVARALRARSPRCGVAFVGTTRTLEREIVERFGFEYHALPSPRLPKSALGAPDWAMRSVGGLLGARKLMQRLRPDIVVSLGGHAALSPSLAARLGHIPLVIMEQNAYPGKANRLLSWWAEEVYAPWDGVDNFFAYPDRVHVTGNPVRAELQTEPARRPSDAFGLDPRKKTLLIMGGSLGAEPVNRCIVDALPLLADEASRLQILHSAGATGYERTVAAYRNSPIRAAVFPFIEDMAAAYGAASLAVCRAGGTTTAELTARGLPAILIPLPFAANDHQRRNAARLAAGGAAIILDQKELTPERLVRAVRNLLGNESLLGRMSKASRRLGRPVATANVIERIRHVVEGHALPREFESLATR